MAAPEGLKTIWNTSSPLALGRIYHKKKAGPKGGYVLSHPYQNFEEQTNSPSYCQVSKSHSTWQKEVNSSFRIKPQLGYMGLGVNPSYSNTKKITFSAKGDEIREIKQFDSYVAEVLNSEGTGLALRENVYQDSLRLKEEQLPLSEARYWIVTNLMTAKDLSIDFSSTPNTDINISAADADTLKKFLQVDGLAVAGSGGGTSESKNRSVINAPEPLGVVAWCVPLTASKVDGKIVMKVEEDHPIQFASTIR